MRSTARSSSGNASRVTERTAAATTNGSTPRIAGQHYRVIAKQIVDFRYGKRWDFRMEGMADRHHITGAQDIADVAAYVSKLARPGNRGIGSGEFVAEGSRIFAQQCQSCHGKDSGGQCRARRAAPRRPALQLSRAADVRRGRRPASRTAGTAFAAHRTTRLRTGASRVGFPRAHRLGGELRRTGELPNLIPHPDCLHAGRHEQRRPIGAQRRRSPRTARARRLQRAPAPRASAPAAQIAGEVVREPMFALLIAAAVIYAVLGRTRRSPDAARHSRPSP